MKKKYIIAGCIISLPIVTLLTFLIPREIKYRYLQTWCARDALKGLSLQEIREKFGDYPSSKKPFYNNDEKSMSEFFAISEFFGFAGCFIVYDKNTLDIKDIQWVFD